MRLTASTATTTKSNRCLSREKSRQLLLSSRNLVVAVKLFPQLVTYKICRFNQLKIPFILISVCLDLSPFRFSWVLHAAFSIWLFCLFFFLSHSLLVSFYFISILSECNGSKQLRFTGVESLDSFTSRPTIHNLVTRILDALVSWRCGSGQRENNRWKMDTYSLSLFASFPRSLFLLLCWVSTTTIALSHSLHLALPSLAGHQEPEEQRSNAACCSIVFKVPCPRSSLAALSNDFSSNERI